MRNVHKKIKHHLSKMSGFYARGLGGLLAIFSIFAGVFFITQAKDPYISELAFIEQSVGNIGSVIPASCSSAPPTNHFAGDCPPAVEVNLGTGSNNLTASITGVTSSEYITQTGPNSWSVGVGGYYTPGLEAYINYTSGGGSMKCRLERNQILSGTIRPPNGTISVNIYPQSPNNYLIICTDGIYFTRSQTISITGGFYYVPPSPPESSNDD